MSATDLKEFLKALEVIKKDFTCPVCSEICKDPVKLSKCFHIICSEHYSDLDTCPDCGISLQGCNTFVNDRLTSCVESIKTLDLMMATYQEAKTKTETVSKVPKKGGKRKKEVEKASETSQTTAPKDAPMKTTKKTRQKKQQEVVELDIEEDIETLKENHPKPNQSNKSDSKSKTEIANMSLLSSASSKFNKAAEKRNNKGETMLHIACRLGKIEKVMELLNQGANTNTKDNAGWTPLHEVVQNGRLDLVQLLLQYNTLINVPGQGNETPLHEAVRYKHKDIAVELVRNGADINGKNCKGETPLHLASPDMKKALLKAADEIVQTQSINISHISTMYTELDMEDVRIYCASQYKTVLNKIKLLMRHHNNIHIETKWSRKVTHMIVDAEDGVCKSSVDVLQGIVSCIWILTTDWVMKSTEEKLELFADYEVVGVGTKTYNGPKNARYNKYRQYPGIFDGCHFFLHNFNAKYEISKTMVITKVILSKLITDAGGVVLRRAPNPEAIPDSEKLVPFHAKKDGQLTICAHYIIYKDMYEPLYNMKHLKALPIGWLIECIEKYELCEPW